MPLLRRTHTAGGQAFVQGNVSAGSGNYITTDQAASSGGSEGTFQSSKSSFYPSTTNGGGFTLSFLPLNVNPF